MLAYAGAKVRILDFHVFNKKVGIFAVGGEHVVVSWDRQPGLYGTGKIGCFLICHTANAAGGKTFGIATINRQHSNVK